VPTFPDTLRHPTRATIALALALASALLVTGVGFAMVGGQGPGAGTPGAPMPSPGGVKTPGPVNTAFPGLTTFRGNLTRTYYGQGPVPSDPVIRWREPRHKMCMSSIVGVDSSRWCGTGWTGQPNVIQNADGTVEVREGAYDGRYHFVNGSTGAPVRPDLVTRDLAKGSATSDPDGYPLYYGGSRDNFLRVIALDRPQPTVLWELNADTAVPRPIWNNDWDGDPLVVDGYLIEGGEDGYLFVIRLNRAYGADGLVTVRPKVVAKIPGWDAQLIKDLGDRQVSIENSVSFRDGVVYFANSGGLVQGWDISDLLKGGTQYHRVFRFWTGDDTDASVVIDGHGDLYVASEYQRYNDRAQEVGQLMKLDPSNQQNPEVWGIPARTIGFENAGGSWSTPALYGGRVFFTTAAGQVLEVDKATGQVLYRLQIGAPTIGSPVVVDNVLIQGDCTGDLYAWNVASPTQPPGLIWKRHFNGCIESTPAVWHGWLYFGTREGYLYGLANKPPGG
jgi:outer membrane protein assembly factor BamB